MAEPLDLNAIRGRYKDVSDLGHSATVGGLWRVLVNLPDVLDEVTRLRAELDAEREGHREQRAAAFEEGWLAGVTHRIEVQNWAAGDRSAPLPPVPPNPYREATP